MNSLYDMPHKVFRHQRQIKVKVTGGAHWEDVKDENGKVVSMVMVVNKKGKK